MKTLLRHIMVCSLAFFYLLGAGIAYGISPEQAASVARGKVQGRILDIKSATSQGLSVYLVKLITQDSRVVIIRVDAKTGRVLP